MKRTYSKHQYSGPKVNPKRSRAAFKQHNGNEKNRADAWRNSSETEVQKEPTLKTYQANHRNIIPEDASKTKKKRPRASQNTHSEQCHITWPTDPEVDNHVLTIEAVDKRKFSGLERLDGYRIVDIKHVFTWLLNLQSDHSKVCTSGKVQFIKERKDGLASIYVFRCDMCKKTWEESSELDEKINKSYVWGTLTAASHFSQANHLLSIMDIPTMSADKFHKLETELGDIWEEHLWKEMNEAAAKEKEIAIEKGHISPHDGVPYITVHVDGGWSKRSYGHNYNASSGIACIIGVETQKCLFLGIRNKYCNMCVFNEKAGVKKEHKCFQNYTGSSTGMEADILVEGFSRSIEMYGLRYTSFVGDGDSSVFARLQAKVPYGNIIKKEECKNHVIKNYTSALFKIAGDTKLPLEDRKIVKSKINKLTTVARMNIKANDNAENMRKDLKNGPLHVFGEHADCKKYYCRYMQAQENGEIIEKDINHVPQLKKHVVTWALIETAIENIARKANRLLNHLTNNIAENFMSLVAKFICGKRINFSRGGSYRRRAQLAGLCQVSGQKWQAKAWKCALKISPGSNFKKLLARKEKSAKLRKTRIRKRIYKEAQDKKVSQAEADKDYGPKADDVPMEVTDEELKKLCEEELQKLQISSIEEIDNIQQKTVGQHGNNLYDELRKNRLTASQFGMICKRRSTTPCDNHVKSILYARNFSNEDTKYGQKYEKVAIKMFESQTNKIVVPSGLFIDHEYGFLGGSPDGLVVGEEALVEVKCFPSLVRSGRSIKEAAEINKNFPIKMDTDSTLIINKKHNFYYQVQGQLRVTKLSKCYFICFISLAQPLTVIEVDRNEQFISNMIPKLVTFFKDCVLPEIVLRQVEKNGKCIDLKEFKTDKNQPSTSSVDQ